MFKITFILLLITLGFSSCGEDKRKVSIESPQRGSMISESEEVELVFDSGGNNVQLDGEPVSSSPVYLEPVDGLAFVKLSIPGDPLFDVRSYLQGSFYQSDEPNPSTMRMKLMNNFLSGDGCSLASLIAQLLTMEELAGYVDNPLQMTVDTTFGQVSVDVVVTSVISPDVSITLSETASGLFLNAYLSDVDLEYETSSSTLNSSGTGYYEYIDIEADVELSLQGLTLNNVVVDKSSIEITDSGNLPATAVDSLGQLFDEEITQAIVEATQSAASDVFVHLIANLVPQPRIDYSNPLASSFTSNSVQWQENGILLAYDSLITASEPIKEKGGIFSAAAVSEYADGGNDISVNFGSSLVNQIAYAVWDGGNFDSMRFTKGELENLGMGELDFPYSNLKHADITLLLSPILSWDEDGPFLETGGIEIKLSISGASDSTAWTAARTPVKLVKDGNDLKLELDEERELVLFDTGFNKMSKLVDQSKVVKLLKAAVPGVVKRIFGDVPMVKIDPVNLQRLDGSEGPVLQPSIYSITRQTEYWNLILQLQYAK
ncbi:MAG: hypothetical protein ACQES9_06620 [Myxococcota bacterium]